MALVVYGLGGEEVKAKRGMERGIGKFLCTAPLLGFAPSSALSLLSGVLRLRFTNVTFLLSPSSLQNARQAESNCTVKSMGQRKTGLSMGRTLGRRGIRVGRSPRQLRFVSYTEVLLRL